MFAVLLLLRARRRMTARQLAEELEIHIRTVYRCIDALCVSGVPIVSETGRDGGYYLADNFKLEPLFFDEQEQKSLLHAARFVRESGYPHEEALNRAVAKIKRYAPAEQAERLETQEAYLEVMHPPANSGQMTMLREIESAMDAQTSVELHYDAGYGGTPSIRKFDPYGIVHWKGKWYAVGYCHLREEIRHFRVDRIREVRSVDSPFQRPPSFSARDSLLESLLPEAGNEAGSRSITVSIQGSPQALDDLCGHWLFSRALVERTANHSVFQMDERSLYLHTPYYLLSFGGAIQVLQPSELRDTLADIAESLHHQYRT